MFLLPLFVSQKRIDFYQKDFLNNLVFGLGQRINHLFGYSASRLGFQLFIAGVRIGELDVGVVVDVSGGVRSANDGMTKVFEMTCRYFFFFSEDRYENS